MPALENTRKTYAILQEQISQVVQSAKIPHALLFSGQEGSLALSLAHHFVEYLHCTARKAQSACGTCLACRKVNKFVHPDVHYVFPVGESKKIKAKEVTSTAFLPLWRSFVQEQPYGNLQDWSKVLGNETSGLHISKMQIAEIRKVVSQESFESECKSVIVWLPEYLHAAAGNTFLKMVEEPAQNTFFVFVSLHTHRILPTLYSRLWPLYVPPLQDEAMYHLLQASSPAAETQQLREAVHIAQGNVRLAQQLLGESTENYFATFAKWLRCVYAQKFGELVTLAEDFHQYVFAIQQNWVAYGLQCFRRILRVPFQDAIAAYLPEEERLFCSKFSSVASMDITETLVELLESLARTLVRHANAKLAFLSTSLHAARLFAKPGAGI